MAWIHPETNGDYKILSTTASSASHTSSDITVYDTEIQTSADTNFTDSVALSLTWKCVGSTTAVDARDNIGTFSCGVYNLIGELLVTGSTAMWSTGLVNDVNRNFNNTPVGGPVRTGTDADGTGLSTFELGQPNNNTGTTGNIGVGWIDQNVQFPSGSTLPIYGISQEISTVSGSLSGTQTRSQTDIWAVGAITLTADVDFGGTVDLKAALDVSQVPTFSAGDFSIDVGSGGTITGIKIATSNAGTNNTITGNVSGGMNRKIT